MGCPSECFVGDNLVFGVCCHDPDTGILTDASSPPTYRIYEDETATPILTGSMAKLDDADTTGFYTELIACTALAGFEAGKTYTIYIEATVDGNLGGITFGFKARSPILTELGMSEANLNEQLDLILAGVGAGGGTGANTITVTVTDLVTEGPLEGAKVRFTKGAESNLVVTNASGVAVFSLDNGTWAVAITLSGYTFTPTTLVVAASDAVPYTMTAVTIPASDPGMVTGWTYCYDEEGIVAAAVDVSIVLLEFLDVPTWEDEGGVAGFSDPRIEASDADGLVTFTNMFTGARYQIYSESGVPRTFTIPADATGAYKFPAIVRKT